MTLLFVSLFFPFYPSTIYALLHTSAYTKFNAALADLVFKLDYYHNTKKNPPLLKKQNATALLKKAFFQTKKRRP